MLDTALINKTTGEISFAGTDFVLKRDLNRRVMESHSDFVKMMFDLSEEGKDISDYILKSQYAIAGINFEVTIRCEGDRIKNVYLKNAREDFQDNDWNWSEKKQIERMKTHNEWLEREFGNKGNDLPWGFISSEYNPLSGMSYILIQYK